ESTPDPSSAYDAKVTRSSKTEITTRMRSQRTPAMSIATIARFRFVIVGRRPRAARSQHRRHRFVTALHDQCQPAAPARVRDTGLEAVAQQAVLLQSLE